MKLIALIVALLLLVGCGHNGGPRPSSMNVIAPAEAGPYIEPPAGRPGPAPVGVGLPRVHRVTLPPRSCQIKTKTTMQGGHKRVTKYQVCYRR